jgi:hypothetical protein
MSVAVGDTYGRWTVVAPAPRGKWGQARWACRCACSEERVVDENNLKSNHSQSCGCLRRETLGARSRGNTHRRRHGDSHPQNTAPEYLIWQAMKKRCGTPSDHDYSRYGGRGIQVCERWRGSYEAFLADMGRRPSSDHSLDRIDNDGNYEPGNVRWTTKRMQGRNRSTNRLITVGGESRPLADWAETAGISRGTIRTRLRLGWSPEEAVWGRGARNA